MANDKVFNLTTDNFNEFINSDTPCLVDFWAPWCGPCQMLGPVIDEVALEYDGKIKVGKVNIDEQGALAQQYRVMTIPTVMIMKNGEVVDKNVGAVSLETMEDFIDKNI